jgi:hypothetical protein
LLETQLLLLHFHSNILLLLEAAAVVERSAAVAELEATAAMSLAKILEVGLQPNRYLMLHRPAPLRLQLEQAGQVVVQVI